MRPWICAALPIAVLLAGCGSDDGPGRGTLKVSVVDAPVTGAKNVFVQFSGVELQGPDGRVTQTFTTPKKIDLLAFSGLNSMSLFEGTLTAGSYQWIRLIVDTAGSEDTCLVDASDAKHELTIPSADETGLKLVSGFTVPAGGVTDFTIDFDLRKSLVLDSNGFKLKPALRIVDTLQTGTLAGSLALSSCPAGITPVVYVFSGSGATPDDIKGNASDPLATAPANVTTGAYVVGFLPVGNYTVTFTCQAANDDPTTDDRRPTTDDRRRPDIRDSQAGEHRCQDDDAGQLLASAVEPAPKTEAPPSRVGLLSFFGHGKRRRVDFALERPQRGIVAVRPTGPGSKPCSSYSEAAMEMKRISAGKLRAIGYDRSARRLRVELDNGVLIDYSGVGEEIWRRLTTSGSAWSFYRDNIEEEFAAERVVGDASGNAAKKANPLDDLFKK